MLDVAYPSAGAGQHGMRRCGVPRHGGAKARVYVGRSLRDTTQFQRRACCLTTGHLVGRQKPIKRLGITVVTAA